MHLFYINYLDHLFLFYKVQQINYFHSTGGNICQLMRIRQLFWVLSLNGGGGVTQG